jgi:hypothetical protein
MKKKSIVAYQEFKLSADPNKKKPVEDEAWVKNLSMFNKLSEEEIERRHNIIAEHEATEAELKAVMDDIDDAQDGVEGIKARLDAWHEKYYYVVEKEDEMIKNRDMKLSVEEIQAMKAEGQA